MKCKNIPVNEMLGCQGFGDAPGRDSVVDGDRSLFTGDGDGQEEGDHTSAIIV